MALGPCLVCSIEHHKLEKEALVAEDNSEISLTEGMSVMI